MSAQSEPTIFLDAEHRAMRRRDRELIPRRLVIAMFSLAAASLMIVSYAVLSDRAHVGRPAAAPVVAEATFTLAGEGPAVLATAPDGTVLLDTEKGAFISVVRDGLERARLKARVAGNPPVTLARHENGRLSLSDPATGWSVELTSFGRANLALWDPLLN